MSGLLHSVLSGSSTPWMKGPGGGPGRTALRGWTGKGHRSLATSLGGFRDAVTRDSYNTTHGRLLF